MTTRELLTNSAAVIVHADLSASSAERWWHCPGSIRMIRLLPFTPPPSIYARRGTAMHKGGAQWLTTGEEPQWNIELFDDFEFEEDEIEAVQTYVATVYGDMALYDGNLFVEQKFSLASLREGMFGTNDAMLVGCTDNVLRVYDFKGGKGVPVEVEHNFQLLYYAYGALLTVKDAKIDQIELIIVQPRARHPNGPVRRWRIDLIDAFDWQGDLMMAAARTDGPNAPLHGGDWCRWCPAAGVCKEYERWAGEVGGADFSPIDDQAVLPDPQMMTSDDLGVLLPKLPFLEEWIAAVRNYAHAEAEAGRVPTGHKLVAKRGRRQWMVPDNEVAAAFSNLGLTHSQIYKLELRSPAQMEKQLPKSTRPMVGKYAAMISSGTILVPWEDSRDAVEGTGVAAFTALPGGQDVNEDNSP